MLDGGMKDLLNALQALHLLQLLEQCQAAELRLSLAILPHDEQVVSRAGDQALVAETHKHLQHRENLYSFGIWKSCVITDTITALIRCQKILQAMMFSVRTQGLQCSLFPALQRKDPDSALNTLIPTSPAAQKSRTCWNSDGGVTLQLCGAQSTSSVPSDSLNVFFVRSVSLVGLVSVWFHPNRFPLHGWGCDGAVMEVLCGCDGGMMGCDRGVMGM